MALKERLGGRASPGQYGRGRCVMSRAERLKSAADQSSRLVLTPRLPVCL
jgi:hypothetical protein